MGDKHTGHHLSGNLPKISDYSWQRRRDYLMLVAAVAAADGKLHKYEAQLLDRWFEDFNLPPKSREAVMGVAKKKLDNQHKIEKRLGKTDLAYSLILDMMGMAMADGVLKDKEIALLRGVADSLDVDPIHFNILIEFVHSAHQASKLNSPEPLYEHTIESAFELLMEQKVRLFDHTLLCVSSEKADHQLKDRWYQYLHQNNAN